MRKTFRKKFGCLFFALLLTLSLAGCAGTAVDETAGNEADRAAESAVDIAAESVADHVEDTAEESVADNVEDTAAESAADNVEDMAADSTADKAPVPVVSGVETITKHGNVVLEITFDEMKQHDMEIGDIITVTVGDASYDLPIGTLHSDVDAGKMVCRFSQEHQQVGLLINMGSFAAETGIGEKQTIEEDPGFQWEILIPEVTLCLKEKAGYLEEYFARNLTRTNVREDYPELSDEEFGNFRAVSVTGIEENYLYRSSSPINPALGRDTYVMEAMEKAGIRCVLNLADSVDDMEGFAAYPDSYYSRCQVINAEMSYDFAGEEFGESVRKSILFMLENEGPYLIHCKEGKDRTGVLCAILEGFAGASLEEIGQDYMLTYTNFYGITPDHENWSVIQDSNLFRTLCSMFGVNQLDGADIQAESREYLLSVGLTEDQLDQLAETLSPAAEAWEEDVLDGEAA